MREVNIAGLDLNLVPVLEALLRLRNVTQAGAEVGLSQPAASRALARLRDLQGDPLLVRTGGGYVLTPRAQAIQPILAEAVGSLKGVFETQPFDPAAQQRPLRLVATDAHTVTLVPGVAARLAAEAPGVDLRVQSYGPDTIARIERDELDLAFALSSTPLPPGVYSEVVAEDDLALVMRRGHPAADRVWRIEDYGAFAHVAVSLIGDGQSEMDAVLAASRVSRRIAVTTPHFMAALAIVGSTDLVTTISGALARRFASTFDLIVKRPPFGETVLKMTLVSSHVRAGDPFLAWFRGVVREVASSAMEPISRSV